MKKNCVYLILFMIIATSCGSTKTVTFNVTQPAEITMPAEAHTILLIDRTKFGNEMMNMIEGILTGELPTDDKAAAQQALISLKDKLNYSPRFSVKILPDRFIGNSMGSAFPDALSWDFINKLCIDQQAEIVIALEVFDSNFITTNGKRVKKRTEGEGVNKREIEYTEYYAEGVGSVKMGIRTYYNKDKTIVDQQMFAKNNRWEATGTSAADALAMLISKSNANKYLARAVGGDYAYKISPMPISISRPFYGKSKHISEVAEGARYADVNKWTEAIDVWKRGLTKAKEKEAGYLAYNIAIGYEVLGEYGTALTWAQDSYTKYENKKGRYYVYDLQRRIDNEELLKKQMN
jgi:hypothetical protein